MAGKDRENEITMRENRNFTEELHGGKRSYTEYLRETSQPRRSVLSRSLFTVHCLLLIILFLSCKSLPKTPDMDLASLEKTGLPLESGAMIYLIADVEKARPVIDLLPIKELKDNQTKQMLEKTDFLAAALFPKESGRRFQLAAWGNYPSSGADMAFGINKNWKQLRAASGYSYWYSDADRLSITVNPKQAFAAASVNDMPAEPVTAAFKVKMPEGFAEFRKITLGNKSTQGNQPSPLSCWFNDGGPVINRALNNSGLPIRFQVHELFIAFFTLEGGRYQAAMRMQFENQSQARGMASLLSVANNFIYGELGGKSLLTSIFFANKPVQNENYIDIITAALKEEEIAQFLGLFQFK
jgi:hypothetical protein